MKKQHLGFTLKVLILTVIVMLHVNVKAEVKAKGKDNMSEYLKETKFCDFDHPIFKNIPIKKSASDTATAIDIFYYTRDTVILDDDRPDVTASDTLKKKYGACWQKAKLMVALLRKHSIPSKVVFRFLKKSFLDPWAVNEKKRKLVERLQDPFYHFFVQVYLNGKWVYADPSIDKQTYEKCYRPLNLPWVNDWDGKSDHIIHTTKIASPIQIVDDIDQLAILAGKASKARKAKAARQK